jgi:GT2 family glycosyltransferase
VRGKVEVLVKMSSQTIKALYESHEGKTSDKWSLYLDEYEKIFAPYRCRPVCLLEIGVQNGGSLDIWGNYFSQAEKIIGCDIDSRCADLQYDDPRIVVIVADANSDECEQKILAQSREFQIIIDDGSHKSSDIGRSFARYFRHLKDGGVYVVEDLHASYWEEFEGGLHHPGSTMAFLKRLADIIHHEHWQNRRTRRRRDLLARYEQQLGIEFDEFELATIHSIEFVNSLCIIRKLSPDQNVLGHRVVSGTDEYVSCGWKKFNRTTVRDIAAGFKDDSDLEIFDLIARVRTLEEQCVQVTAERDRAAQELVQAKAERDQVQEIVRIETNARTALEGELQRRTEQETTLLRIYQSHGWKALALYYRVRDRLLPEGSYRRTFAKKIFHAIFGSAEIKNSEQYEMPHPGRNKFLSQDAQITVRAQVSKLIEISDIELPLAPSAPLVSIIIPVYNQFNFTLRCLKSIQENSSKASAEILIIDDASQDETPKALPNIRGIRYIRNEANLGFLRSCNRAASEARGEYLVFLNNDTEVQKDWVDHMLAVFERDSRVGIVGAKLIYPDGRMQEAGGLIWSDGSAMNFGRDDDPGKPEYNYLRETDYCSAACILIKAALFQEVNGFDELFEPAYYEDVDLAFKVRAKGYKVLCQPAAQITHFEGGTCGTDLNSGVKSYQQINAQKFYAKWSHVLTEYSSGKNQDLMLARDRRVVGRCLFVDVWPTPDRDAGSIYTIYLVKLFQHFSYKVTFFPGNTIQHFGKYTEELQQMGVECLHEPFVTTLEKYLDRDGRYFDVVILCRADQAIPYFDAVRLYCPNAKIIFHTVDLHYLREERAARVKNSIVDLKNAQQLKIDEIEICRKADCTLVPSMSEVSLLGKEVPDAYVECFPFVLSIPGRKKRFDERQNIAFIAGYLHEPNVDAITYFVREIWPHIAERLPHGQLLLVGSNMPEAVRRLAGDRIRAVGYVQNLTQFLENCRLTVAPLRYGAGIKGKVISSLAHGVPVIASPLGVEGMGCEHGVHLLVADTTAEWSESVAMAYTNENLWEYLSDNGLALMREAYSIEAGVTRLQAMLTRLGCPLPSSFEMTAEAHLSISNPSNGEKNFPVSKTASGDEVRPKGLHAETDGVRAIAFYLPQYHPIPENDRWWGKGFTEWTYVASAKPLFPGHYQPHLPSELGFYDLRLEEVREAQADLAREHGIYGFCYHFYWFGGKRLLDRPLTEMLVSGRPNFPFCLCWANENWTRRWDGRDQEILFKQEYSPEGDLAFIRELLPILSDHRYIRVNGKPLVLVYRTEDLPNPKKTAETWREESIKARIGDLYLCRVESFSAVEPGKIGFDAACQFPPLLIGSPELDPVLVFNGTDPSAFKGKMFDYRGLAQQALNAEVHYKHFLGVTPSWDNTPRTGQRGYIWLNSLPEEYESWFVRALRNTVRLHRGEERVIFINAWNEWGEGCHLEPDQRYERALLQATRRALGAINKIRASES